MEPQRGSKFIRSSLCTNDVEWYKHYETLSSDTGSLFMSRPNGTNYPDMHGYVSIDGTINNGTVTNANITTKQGGILKIRYIPMYGGDRDFWKPNVALNNAASKLYYYIVHGNSRNISYDKSDLMRCIIAFDNIQILIEEAKRAYRFAKYIKVSNKWARRMVTALGWDVDDISADLVNFRAQINLAIQKFNQISIPAVFDIFKSHVEQVSFVYEDRLDDKAQYMFNAPIGYWLYNDEKACLDLFTTGRLNGTNISQWGSANTVRGFTTLVNYMLHTVYDSTDMGVMQGDIKRAFSDTPLLTIDMLSDDDFVPIVYDEEFNLKLHNIEFGFYPGTKTISPSLEYDTSYTSNGVIRDVDSVNGNLTCGLIARNDAPQINGTFLDDDVHMMDLPDHNMEDLNAIILAQTRKLSARDDSALYFVDDTPGSELDMHFYDCLDSVAIDAQYYFDVYDMTKKLVYHAPYFSSWEDIAAYAKFSELDVTFFKIFFGRNSSSDPWKSGPSGWEVNNVTVYSDDVFRNMINVMTESLFYNPLLYNKA